MQFKGKNNRAIRLIKVNITTVGLCSYMSYSAKTIFGEKRLLWS